MRNSLYNRQKGMTLFVALIMLVLLMMAGIAAYHLSRNNTVATGNVQYRMETVSAASATIEDVLSSTNFISNPGASINGCGANQNCFDVNGDGTPDIVVKLTPPPCIKKAQPIKNSAITDPSDPCGLGAKQTLGVEGTTNDNSLCANTLWEITAEATDAVTSAKSTIAAGVAVRVSIDDAVDTSHVCTP